jgi:CubicO group peptidase (beta-lactamase class C family)
VEATIQCTLLPLNDYQTAFCQEQYQHVVSATLSTFNPSGQNAQPLQTVGGMFGIYAKRNGADTICYVSCGVEAIGGSAPTETTVFELASVTKTFTAAILGKRVYLGLNPLTPVTVPAGSWLGQSYSLNPTETPVTYQQLATFAGGFCYSDAPDVAIFSNNTLQKQADFVQDVNALDRNSPTCLGSGSNVAAVYNGATLPSKNLYSNSSVGFLAQVLMAEDNYQEMTEAQFNLWLCENILVPLNMTQTNACLPDEASNGTCATALNTSSHNPTACNAVKAGWQAADYATGYHHANGALVAGVPFPFVPWYGAGNVRSNAQDMVNYLRAYMNNITSVNPDVTDLEAGMQQALHSTAYMPVPNGETVILNKSAQMPLKGGQGYAWVCDPFDTADNSICGKLGGHTNFQSFIVFNQTTNYGLIILFNTGEVTNTGGLRTPYSTLPTIGEIGVALVNQYQP